MEYTVEIIKDSHDFQCLEVVWNNLLSQSPTNTYFMRWEWVSTWWDVYSQPDDELHVIIIKNIDSIVSIAPFYIRKRYIGKYYPSKLLMFLGTQYHGKGDVCSDYFDLIYIKSKIKVKTLVNTVFDQINNNYSCDEVFLSRIDEGSITMKSFIKQASDNGLLTVYQNQYYSPYIKLPKSWEDYMSSISASMRYKINREQRRLEKYNNVKFRKTEALEELNNDYSELIRLHEERWSMKGEYGSFSNAQFSKFHDSLLLKMLKNGHLDLRFLCENGKNIAVFYLIKYNNKVYFYQSGIEIKKHKMALGYALHSYCINEAIKEGFSEYDFLPEADINSYKKKYTKQNRGIANVYLCKNRIIKMHFLFIKSAKIFYRYLKRIFFT